METRRVSETDVPVSAVRVTDTLRPLNEGPGGDATLARPAAVIDFITSNQLNQIAR